MLVAAAALGALAWGSTAHAAAGDWGYTTGGNVRACAGWCAIVWVASPGWLRVWCWRDGAWTAGSPRWFLVGRDGQFGGYMHASLVPVQPSVPRC
jgi:hypothetical protein